MHSDGDADVDIVSSALTVVNTCPVTLLGVEKTLAISSSLTLQSDISLPRVLIFQLE